MRDISFRGKRVDTKEWIDGSLISLDSGLVGNHRYIVDKSIKTNLRRASTTHNEYDWRAFGVEPSTVGQFTGLLDKNGQKIFEGDMISTDLMRGFLVVEFKGGAFVFNCNDGEDDYYDHICFSDNLADVYQYGVVIGNIHDNPDGREAM